MWATILALIWLHGVKMDTREEWELLALKAVSWLRAQNGNKQNADVLFLAVCALCPPSVSSAHDLCFIFQHHVWQSVWKLEILFWVAVCRKMLWGSEVSVELISPSGRSRFTSLILSALHHTVYHGTIRYYALIFLIFNWCLFSCLLAF